jgi:hypothetical protein
MAVEFYMSADINHDRRRFLSSSVMAIAAAEFGVIGSAAAQPDKKKHGTNTYFYTLKQIDAGVLNVG